LAIHLYLNGLGYSTREKEMQQIGWVRILYKNDVQKTGAIFS